MSDINEDYPWLPGDIGPDFDPLTYADVTPSAETPFVIIPRGGAREVGRSCYQVETQQSTFLVDCGLSQSDSDIFPDFRGLSRGQVDGVFLTHAHVDHCGGLPVLEAESYLADDATIVMTEPTNDLARLLLEDSLKIHRQEAAHGDIEQRYEQSDFEAVCKRFEPVPYGGGLACGVTAAHDTDSTIFQFGNAAHLLGSAWLTLTAHNLSVTFSGDLGGRTPHLSNISPPPDTDTLLLESTYGSTHTHRSLSEARNELIQTIKTSVQNRQPVLIPTFAVGRAQTILGELRTRLDEFDEATRTQIDIIVDGLAQNATKLYHQYIRDNEWVDDTVVNRVTESGYEQPFRPTGVHEPESDAEREGYLAGSDAVPVVIAPSGMFTGGHSPRYLAEFAARYDEATVVFIGYQAVETPGRIIQSQSRAGTDEITVEIDHVDPFGTQWPENPHSRGAVNPRGETLSLTLPASWIAEVEGLSAHASQHGLRDFCRDAAPRDVALIHGPDIAQSRLAENIQGNIDSVSKTTRTGLLSPIPVERDAEFDLPALTDALTESDERSMTERVEALSEQIALLNKRVAELEDKTE